MCKRGIPVALAACLLPAVVFAQGGYYPSPSGSLNRYAATQLYAGSAGDTLVGISSATVPTADAAVYTGDVFASNRTLSLRAAGNIVFTANQTGTAASLSGITLKGGVDTNGQYKAVVSPVDVSAGGQVYLQHLCRWDDNSSCSWPGGVAGTIIATAQTDGGTAHITFGPCVNWINAKLYLCCNFTTLTLPADTPPSGAVEHTEVRTIPCETGYVTQTRSYSCSGTTVNGGEWKTVSNNCAACIAPQPEFRTLKCTPAPSAPPEATVTGEITQMRSYTCPGSVAGAWKTIADTCVTHSCALPQPATETRTQPCSIYPVQYSAGAETQQRTWSCVNNIPVVSEWKAVSGACQVKCLASGQFISRAQPLSAVEVDAWLSIGAKLPAQVPFVCNMWGRCCCSGKLAPIPHWGSPPGPFWGCQ